MASSTNKEALTIISLAVGSLAVGFVLVFFLTERPAESGSKHESCNESGHAYGVTYSEAYGSDADIAENESSPSGQTANQGDAPPEVPPGPVPKGVRINGAPLYFRCGDSNSAEYPGEKCDRLRILEKRMATRLYVVEQCRIEAASKNALGILSLATHVDFDKGLVKFWSAPSSEISNAKSIGKCILTKLAGLPLHGIEHKYKEYRLFFTVEFFSPKKFAREIAKKRLKGRTVKVEMDHVNVREAPANGMSIGRISSDSSVTFLRKNESGTWCLVITPNDREGWMICDAIAL